MAKVEFEIADGFTPLTGVAVIEAANPEGYPILATLVLNDPRPVEQIGLLTTALDQIRYTFVDKDVSSEDLFGGEEDEEE